MLEQREMQQFNKSLAHMIRSIAILLLLIVTGSSSWAQEQLRPTAEKKCLDKACFTETVTAGNETLKLRGLSLFEYWAFDIYTGAFYTAQDVQNIDGALSDIPKVLVLDYHHALKASEIIENSEHILKKNPNLNLVALRIRLNQLYQSFKNVTDGDRYTMQYLPGEGTTFYLNGVRQLTIPGSDFQKAYFGIWLSQYSVSKDFTKGLLGLLNIAH